jgi:hypothetical protein
MWANFTATLTLIVRLTRIECLKPWVRELVECWDVLEIEKGEDQRWFTCADLNSSGEVDFREFGEWSCGQV